MNQIAAFGLVVLSTTVTFTMDAHAKESAGKQVCMATPSAQIPAVDNAQAVAAVRDVFAGYLTGPTLSVAHLQAKVSSQVRQEAQQKGCAFVLFTTVVQHSKTVTEGFTQRIAAGVVQQGASQVAYEAQSAGARVLASAAAGGAGNSYFASTTKAKDQLTLEYRLESPHGKTLAEASRKRKASSPGEDLLTPLVAAAAEEIATEVSK